MNRANNGQWLLSPAAFKYTVISSLEDLEMGWDRGEQGPLGSKESNSERRTRIKGERRTGKHTLLLGNHHHVSQYHHDLNFIAFVILFVFS